MRLLLSLVFALESLSKPPYSPRERVGGFGCPCVVVVGPYPTPNVDFSSVTERKKRISGRDV